MDDDKEWHFWIGVIAFVVMSFYLMAWLVNF